MGETDIGEGIKDGCVAHLDRERRFFVAIIFSYASVMRVNVHTEVKPEGVGVIWAFAVISLLTELALHIVNDGSIKTTQLLFPPVDVRVGSVHRMEVEHCWPNMERQAVYHVERCNARIRVTTH